MKRQSETKPISADGNSPFFRRLAGWQALKPRCQSAHVTIAPDSKSSRVPMPSFRQKPVCRACDREWPTNSAPSCIRLACLWRPNVSSDRCDFILQAGNYRRRSWLSFERSIRVPGEIEQYAKKRGTKVSDAAGIMFQASNRHRFALREVGFLPRARANGSRHCRPSRIVIG